MSACAACQESRHGECENIEANSGAVDALEFVSVCSCACPETEASYACAKWLHNCPGCACSCHTDPVARAIWDEAFRRFSAASVAERSAAKPDEVRIEYRGRRRRVVLEERARG